MLQTAELVISVKLQLAKLIKYFHLQIGDFNGKAQGRVSKAEIFSNLYDFLNELN